MGMFDFLINSNKKAKVGIEYIYLSNTAWVDWTEKPVKYGSIMVDVIKLPNDSFEFTDKLSGIRYTTNYGWSLAENTPENIMSINDYLVSNAKLEILERSTRLLRKKINDLNGPSKINNNDLK